jgi:hypothetical protein
MEAFKITTREHHVIFHIPYEGQWLEWWFTPQDAVDFHYELSTALERMSNAGEGRMYAADLFTYEIGQAMTQTGVRVVDVGEVEA